MTFSVAFGVGAVLVLPQVWIIFKTGRMKKYLAGYISFIVGFAIVAVIARNHLGMSSCTPSSRVLLSPILSFL